MKTALEWFDILYKEGLLSSSDSKTLAEKCENKEKYEDPHIALSGVVWGETKERYKYWNRKYFEVQKWWQENHENELQAAIDNREIYAGYTSTVI